MSTAAAEVPATDATSAEKPIFVVGFPRSGTTLLQGLIGSHPRIAGPPEMHYFRRIPPLRDYWGDLKDDAVLRRVLHETVNPPTHRLVDCGFDVDHLFERARNRERRYSTVLDVVMQDFAERQGKPRWCEKTPLQPPAVIWQHFPTAQVVHIVRDPRDAIASSLSKLGVWDDAASAARTWRHFTVMSVQSGAERGPAQYLRISYEDLARDPHTVMHQVFSFLGEDFETTVLTDLESRKHAVPTASVPWMDKALQPVQAPERDAWRSQLSLVDRLRSAAVLGDMLPAFGYTEPGRRSRLAGALLNTVHAPTDRLKLYRIIAARRRLRTPEERYRASLEEQIERDKGSFERLQRLRAREGAEPLETGDAEPAST